MSVSNGRYEISHYMSDWFILITLRERDPGASVKILEKEKTSNPGEQQWDVTAIPDGIVIIRNVMARLFVGRKGNSVIATLEPYKWTLKEWGKGYAIAVPGQDLVIDDHSKDAVLKPLGDNTDLQWWDFSKI